MILGIIILSVIFTYRSTEGQELNYDDERYIRGNQLIRNLDGAKVVEIFSSYFDGHYHPLTMLSLAVDRSLGENPVKTHHVVNWLLHVANALLVYLFLLALFKDRALAFGVAALFVVHPMAVESYAWMTERKNVLYSVFFLAAGISYHQYLLKRSWAFLGLSFLLFGLSILSKAQAMVLLPVLFLIDWVESRDLRKADAYFDKIPFLVVALLFVFLTSSAQAEEWGELNRSGYSRLDKLFLASWAFIQYFMKGLVPVGLSAYYPYPNDLGQELQWFHYIAPASFVVLLGAAVYAFRRSRVVFFGLGFFFLNLVLMLKFLDVPFGSYLMANRYNYLPLVGLLLLLVYGIFYICKKYKWGFSVPLVLILVVALAYGLISQQRISVWHNSTALWSDILEKYPAYKHAYNMRGLGYLEEGKTAQAMRDFEIMLEMDPDFMDAYANLAVLHHRLGQTKQAAAYVAEARNRFPEEARVWDLAANMALKSKDYEGALTDINKALALDPDEENLKLTKAKALINLNRRGEAREVLVEMPENRQASQLLAALQHSENDQKTTTVANARVDELIKQATELAKQGRYEDAMPLYNRAVELAPDNFVAYLNRGSTLARLGDVEKALSDFRKAKELNPNEARVYFLLGVAYKDLNQRQQACNNLLEAHKRGFPVRQDLKNYCTSQP